MKVKKDEILDQLHEMHCSLVYHTSTKVGSGLHEYTGVCALIRDLRLQILKNYKE